MADTNTAIAKKQHPLVVLRERLEARVDELRSALPSDITPERFIRALTTAAQIDPNLLACTFQSLWIACMRACRDGLLPDGVEGAIVAYKDRAQFIPMYRGLLKKVAPQMKWVTTNLVYDGEQFEHYVDEHGEHLRHVPGDNFGGTVKRVYAMGATKDGGIYIAVMSLAEVEKIRKTAKASREDAPWNAWREEMQKKTALRRLCKLLPITAQLPEDEDEATEEAPKLTAVPAPRERGAAAALDLFASSPEESSQGDSPSQGETGGSGEPATVDAPAARKGPAEAPAAADAHDDTTNAQQSASVTEDPANDPSTDGDPVAAAHEKGRAAKAAGHQRKALPGEYRTPDRDEEAQAWLKGYDGKPL